MTLEHDERRDRDPQERKQQLRSHFKTPEGVYRLIPCQPHFGVQASRRNVGSVTEGTYLPAS